MGRILRDQTIREGISTEGAMDFAGDIQHNPSDIQTHWWELFYNYRTKRWKQEIKNLRDRTGISFEDVCDYIGIPRDRLPGFYRRLPKTKKTYIGIGMAYKQPLATINRWLVKYGGKKKLYIKDALEDLIWIYLINANTTAAPDITLNYYTYFDDCRDKINKMYSNMTKEVSIDDIDTMELIIEASRMQYDAEYNQLKKFIRKNINAFSTAYDKPQKFLNRFLENILRVKNAERTGGRPWTLNSLRGYLDDSMINYMTAHHKEGPRSKKSHIAMGMALGMTHDSLNTYLQLMGYGPLDATNLEEGVLINMLTRWDKDHRLQRRFKDKYIHGKDSTTMKLSEEISAVNDMLRLRSDIKEMYEAFAAESKLKHLSKKFPYMND